MKRIPPVYTLDHQCRIEPSQAARYRGVSVEQTWRWEQPEEVRGIYEKACVALYRGVEALVKLALGRIARLAEQYPLVETGLARLKAVVISDASVRGGMVDEMWTPPMYIEDGIVYINPCILEALIVVAQRLGVEPHDVVEKLLLHEVLHLGLFHDSRIGRVAKQASKLLGSGYSPLAAHVRAAIQVAFDRVVNDLMARLVGSDAWKVVNATMGVDEHMLGFHYYLAGPLSLLPRPKLDPPAEKLVQELAWRINMLASIMLAVGSILDGICGAYVSSLPFPPQPDTPPVPETFSQFIFSDVESGRGRGVGRGDRPEERLELLEARVYGVVVSRLRRLLEALRGQGESERRTLTIVRSPRPSRRTGVAPSARVDYGLVRRGRVYVAFDTSGSVDDELLAAALRAVHDVMVETGLRSIRLILWHTEVYYDGVMTAEQVLSVIGSRLQRGGTRPTSIRDHLEQRGEPLRDSIIVLGSDCIFFQEDTEELVGWLKRIWEERRVRTIILDYSGLETNVNVMGPWCWQAFSRAADRFGVEVPQPEEASLDGPILGIIQLTWDDLVDE